MLGCMYELIIQLGSAPGDEELMHGINAPLIHAVHYSKNDVKHHVVFICLYIIISRAVSEHITNSKA